MENYDESMLNRDTTHEDSDSDDIATEAAETPDSESEPEYDPSLEMSEDRETEIDAFIDAFAIESGMDPDAVLGDLMTFAPREGNDDNFNPWHFATVAEGMGNGMTATELMTYAVKSHAKIYG